MNVEITRWIGSSPTDSDLAELFKKRKLSYYSFSNSKGDHYAAHSHDYNKFLVMAKGKMRWIIDGEEHILSQGDSVVLPKGTVHEVVCLTQCECFEGHF